MSSHRDMARHLKTDSMSAGMSALLVPCVVYNVNV